ncbi:hypothetical protein GF361_02625 [Candidatus Woesearchaeota archaeon]|nr:hypothetical protein [Candidatus Woesearchaeota archaeon]
MNKKYEGIQKKTRESIDNSEGVLTIYWERGQKSPRYVNGGNFIPFQEVRRKIGNRGYSEVQDVWTGPIPVSVWKEIQSRKKDLSRFVKQD